MPLQRAAPRGARRCSLMRLGRAWGNLSWPTQPHSTFPVTDIAFPDFANRVRDPELVVRIRLPPAVSEQTFCSSQDDALSIAAAVLGRTERPNLVTWWRPRRTYRRSRLGEGSVDIQPPSSRFAKNMRSSALFSRLLEPTTARRRFMRTPKSGRYLPKNVSGDGWTPAWIAFAELRMPFVVSSVPKRSIATSSIITSAAAMPPADHALRIVRAAA